MPQVFFLTGSSRGLGRQIAEAAWPPGTSWSPPHAGRMHWPT
jgi:hypothetical protein